MDDYDFGNYMDYSQDYLSPAESYGLYGAEPSAYYVPAADYSQFYGSAPDYSVDQISGDEVNSIYGAQPSVLGQLGDYLGSKQGQGLLSLGLGGLSLYGNYLANKQRQANADAQLGLARQESRLGAANDFAKMHALAQIIQARQGINLDPSLAYAQAVRNEMGLSPKTATPFAGVDVGGPMQVGMSSQGRLNAMNNALGYGSTSVNLASGGMACCDHPDMAMGGYTHGGLGLLRGGTSGQSDKINANLSDGEYVMDADVVSALGDGNTEAGARKLDQMRARVRQHKRSAPASKIPPAAKDPMKYLGK